MKTQLADEWVPQISSKRPGIVDDGVLWNNARTLKEFLDNREKYDAKLLWSGDWSTFSAPDFRTPDMAQELVCGRGWGLVL